MKLELITGGCYNAENNTEILGRKERYHDPLETHNYSLNAT